jgi:hypothetical protein
MLLLFQPAVVATKREIMLNLPTQHKMGILQGLVVEQPVQLCPLCRGVAVFVLHVWRMVQFLLEIHQKKKPETSRYIKKFQALFRLNWKFTAQSASSWGRGKNRPCFRPTGSNNVHDPGGFLEEPSNKLQQRPRKLCTVLVTALF